MSDMCSVIPAEAVKLRASYRTMMDLVDYLNQKKQEVVNQLLYGDAPTAELRTVLRTVDDILKTIDFLFQTHLFEEGEGGK